MNIRSNSKIFKTSFILRHHIRISFKLCRFKIENSNRNFFIGRLLYLIKIHRHVPLYYSDRTRPVWQLNMLFNERFQILHANGADCCGIIWIIFFCFTSFFPLLRNLLYITFLRFFALHKSRRTLNSYVFTIILS